MYPPPSFCKIAFRFLTSGFRFQGGFTLIEMAMVTLIGGIIMASAGTAMTTFLDRARVDTTRIRMEGIENALRQYLSANNKYPCPAALILQQDNVNYGREINVTCSAAGAVAGTSVVRGRTIGAVAQNIRVGAVPVRSLNLPDTYMTDGWGNRFYFAMTEELATPPGPGGTFMADRGGVAIFDGVVGAPPNLITDRAQYAIISPGPNRVGAFNMNGIQAIPCPPELPAATGTVEASNCTFVDPPPPAPKQFRSTLNVSTATVQEAYDDFVTFRTSAEANIALPPCNPGEIRVGTICQSLAVLDTVPSGAVMAFDLATCPSGWNPHAAAAARFLVGVGPGYPLNATGGAAQVTLTVNQMPSHDHAMHEGSIGPCDGCDDAGQAYDSLSGSGGGPGGTPWDGRTRWTIDHEGGGLPHENRPPYLALLFCRKI